MRIVNLRHYPSYFITEHGEVFKIEYGKEVRVPAYYIDYKLYVAFGGSQKELIYLMIEAFELSYKPTDRLRFKVGKKNLSIGLASIKITPIASSVNTLKDDVQDIIQKFECEKKASNANGRFIDKITAYEIASLVKYQKFQCAYCGKGIDYNNWQIDHYHPKTHGGKNVFSNIVACCERCNRMKHTIDGNEFRMVSELITNHSMKFSTNLDQ